ncbi:Ppx/GppA phosphatase family-domain-containing protein [Lipomyces orientalis]|uniref:Ppx/GppA phosphatase family-domain-containing protein n=1 Tax=Lipomyces orientalis TaxID=1233043 RepID=A0ACC3TX39_9ASCO
MLTGVIDIGSNGVRFSVSDLSDSLASRNLPIKFQDRAPISLYDALKSSRESSSDRRISANVLDRLRIAITRFDRVCKALKVPDENVSVFGTAASRSAANWEDMVAMITRINSNWTVNRLSPYMEAKYGAMGIASSYYEINGLVMDLGGGSIQISWVSSLAGNVDMPESAVSLPLGAAAISEKLQAQDAETFDVETFKLDIRDQFAYAFKKIKPPFELKGANLYLSGGGFRGLGFLAMSTLSDDEYYPVPIINGYRCSIKDLERVAQRQLTDKDKDKLEDVFRISKRRASQLPGIGLLIQALISAAPHIGSVYFCQGGVKEGYLYSKLADSVKIKDPLVTCTAAYARPACAKIETLINFAMSSFTPPYISKRMLPAVVNLVYYQAPYTKDTQATAALNIAVTGVLAGVHGLSHVDRALLGIILCERWGGEVFDERVIRRLCDLVVSVLGEDLGLKYLFWGYYLAKLATVLADLFPAGVVDSEDRVKVGLVKDEKDAILIELTFVKDDPCTLAVWDKIEGLEKKVKKFRKKYEIVGVPKVSFKLYME